MKIVSSFSKRLAEATNGMGVTELATKLGVSKQSVSAWLNGTRQPKQLALTAMAQMLSVHPAWLMGYDVPMRQKNEIEEIANESLSALSNPKIEKAIKQMVSLPKDKLDIVCNLLDALTN